jgi:hypothetical protein
MGEGDYGASQCWFNLNISNPQIAGAWALNGQTKYAISDYILQIPSDWAAANTPNMLLATGRYRDGGQEGQGPSLIAYGPWNQGNPPAAGTVLSNIPLLKYSTYYDDPSAAHALRGYSHADAWNDAVWLRKGTKQAVAVIGVKGIGNTWYGLADGSLCPPSCDGDRGWWATRFEAQILLYDPADLAKVAKGQIPAYQPQPYAVYNITGSGALYYPAPRLGLGEAAFDSTNGILYIIEPYADGDMPEHPRPVVHVWKVKP